MHRFLVSESELSGGTSTLLQPLAVLHLRKQNVPPPYAKIPPEFLEILKFSFSDITNPSNFLLSSHTISKDQLIFNPAEYDRLARIFETNCDLPFIIRGPQGSGKTTLIMSLISKLPNAPDICNFRFYKKFDTPRNNPVITEIFSGITNTSDTTLSTLSTLSTLATQLPDTLSGLSMSDSSNDNPTNNISEDNSGSTATLGGKLYKYGRIHYINLGILGTQPEKLAYIRLINYLCEGVNPGCEPHQKYIFVITNIHTCQPNIIVQLEKCIIRHNNSGVAGFIMTTHKENPVIITPKIRSHSFIYRMPILDFKVFIGCLKRTFYTVITRFEHKDNEKMYKFYIQNDGNVGQTLAQIDYWRTHNTNRTANNALLPQICWHILYNTKLGNLSFLVDLRRQLYALCSIGISVQMIVNAVATSCMNYPHLNQAKKLRILGIAADIDAGMQCGMREIIWLERLFINILEILYE
jgi:hypothetical protein